MTRPRRVLWLDASAGIAGDMVLAALVDSGADRDDVVRLVAMVAPEVRIGWEETSRAGLRALRAIVTADGSEQAGSVPSRSVTDIRAVLGSAELPEAVRDLASRVFGRVIAAEAAVHGTSSDSMRLHEVGGWDSIADIVGACAALTALDVDEVVISPIALGSGQVRAAHGILPVPVPGVAELLRGWEVKSDGDGELATPTGAALAVCMAERQGPVPAGRLVAIGVGAGTRDRPDRANVVRALILEQATAASIDDAPDGGTTMLDEIACTVDDLDPRVWPRVLSRLLDDGALDAWLVPVLMKKGRPAHVLHILCRLQDTARLGSLVLEETSTLGYRVSRVARTALARAWVDVSVHGETVPVKLAVRGGVVLRAVAELDEAASAAERSGKPLRDVLESAVQAAARRGVVAGAPVPSDARSGRNAEAPT